MAQFLILLAILLSLYLGVKVFLQANPAHLATFIRRMIGALLCVVALFLLTTGRFAFLAIPVGLAGIAIYMTGRLSLFGGGSSPRSPRPQNGSRVRSKRFEMTLDHDSGQIDGKILQGEYQGQWLSGLNNQALETVYNEVAAKADSDLESLSLIEAYLDSVFPSWREDFHAHPRDGEGAPSSSGPITKEQAYEILGLAPGASESAIRDAHRALMMKVHPDRGGSTFLAAKINEAKDVLLSDHSSAS